MLLELVCAVQNYAWGKIGLQSEVAKLQQTNAQFQLSPDQTYAELWMGTHPSGPSRIKSTNESLSDFLCACTNEQDRIERFGSKAYSFSLNELQIFQKLSSQSTSSQPLQTIQLPFLFKVLSVNKALSIQAHPDKRTAQRLYLDRGDLYKDPNHKPEMAIALSEFEALCQFRPFDQIANFLRTIPQLAAVIFYHETKPDQLNDLKESDLKDLFFRMMSCPADILNSNLSSLLEQIDRETKEGESTKTIPTRETNLLLRLQTQFPGDIGLFSIFFLNYITLQPGQGIFLAANEPHAYLSGECIECMACSDNVVRAGLTPKYIDVNTLCSILTYKTGEPPILLGDHCVDGNLSTVVYQPPREILEFQVTKVELKKGGSQEGREYFLPVSKGPVVFFIYEGEGKLKEGSETEIVARKGQCFFVSANSKIQIQTGSREDLIIWAASCNDSMFE
eukprot:TRINITY_DN3410_c0_g1_i1.p1 TRINITY_DN3410_c0_g1~~TRINITY_DN3410_c0_g1_i1.p1  ORF type:complete len:449 (+),score=95.19 TRINITY_DN3410_c0_g1_i1:57-1403(+)